MLVNGTEENKARKKDASAWGHGLGLIFKQLKAGKPMGDTAVIQEWGGNDSEHIGSSGGCKAWSNLETKDNRICSGLYLGRE